MVTRDKAGSEVPAATSAGMAAPCSNTGDGAGVVFRSKVHTLLTLAGVVLAVHSAYHIRTTSIRHYGRVIHEFDPWFNYRATEYLAEHGSHKFFRWFDHESWYPLGRPIGTTIYPGMQFCAVWVHQVLQKLGVDMSVHDVCVFLPAWLGAVSTVFLGLLVYEVTRCKGSATVASMMFAIIPAHLGRTMGGGFDNESVAMPCMVAAFYFWCRALRSRASLPWALAAGVAYAAMAASWGGYVFAVNMVGVHAFLAMAEEGGKCSVINRSYLVFYAVGTALATQVPVIGMTPLRSLEQMGPLVLFLSALVFELLNTVRAAGNMSENRFASFRQNALATVGIAAATACAHLFQAGYFAPLSSRVRGLIITHTRTGNPLVDSVAEHRATSDNALRMYFHVARYWALLGAACLGMDRRNQQASFLALYAVVSYYFACRMSRLIIILAPACSALAGIAVARLAMWAIDEFTTTAQLMDPEEPEPSTPVQDTACQEEVASGEKVGKQARGKKGKINGGDAKSKAKASADVVAKDGDAQKASGEGLVAEVAPTDEAKHKQTPEEARVMQAVADRNARAEVARLPFLYDLTDGLFQTFLNAGAGFRFTILGCVAVVLLQTVHQFRTHCERAAVGLADPTIVVIAQGPDGEVVVKDDYRESYSWLREQTPEDSRVMAWWDYGYQIGGMARRTTIADGNTWNHEHIATLGRALTNPEKQAHNIIRHLADYVLVWAGEDGSGEDVGKTPHIARIANSVYGDVCSDPSCSKFYRGKETWEAPKRLQSSLIWKMTYHGKLDNATLNPALFEEAYTSKHGLVRIYRVVNVSQESREYASNPANRRCDAPGSWYCVGQYPPALLPLIERRKDFQQLEDFNKQTVQPGE